MTPFKRDSEDLEIDRITNRQRKETFLAPDCSYDTTFTKE